MSKLASGEIHEVHVFRTTANTWLDLCSYFIGDEKYIIQLRLNEGVAEARLCYDNEEE